MIEASVLDRKIEYQGIPLAKFGLVDQKSDIINLYVLVGANHFYKILSLYLEL